MTDQTREALESALIQYEMKKDLESRTAVVEALYGLLQKDETFHVVVAGNVSLGARMKDDGTLPSIETEDGMKIRLLTYTDGEEMVWQTAFTGKDKVRPEDAVNTVEMNGRELCEFILTTGKLAGLTLNPWTTPMFLPSLALQRIMQLL